MQKGHLMSANPPIREAPASLLGKGKDPTRPPVKEPLLNVDNIQGNVLAGFNNDHQTHLSLRIRRDGQDPSWIDADTLDTFPPWLGRLVPAIATTYQPRRF